MIQVAKRIHKALNWATWFDLRGVVVVIIRELDAVSHVKHRQKHVRIFQSRKMNEEVALVTNKTQHSFGSEAKVQLTAMDLE